MEEGEFSDDDDDDNMNGLQDNSGKKDNDTNEDRMKVTEVIDITEISSSKTEHIYTATPTKILKLGQIDKGQKTRFMFNIGGGGGGGCNLKPVPTQLTMCQIPFYSNL